jgi:DNA-binding Lrp family transcriptional regulator
MINKTPDWNIIEGLYKAGERSLRDIAAEHGITEGAIRARAKKQGWVRDAVGTVRKQVNEHIAGFTQGVPQETVRKMMDDAAKSGIIDMEMGISNARKVLLHVNNMLGDPEQTVLEPRDLKVLNEANAGAIETIRRIRQLDEPANQAAQQLTGFRIVQQ